MKFKWFEDMVQPNQIRYEPKRNLNTDLKYFELIPWTIEEPISGVFLLAVAKCSGEYYVAIRDTRTKLEFVEKILLSVSGEMINANTIQIDDHAEWEAAMEFFQKMGIIQNKKSVWRMAKERSR
jgi:uncharacterized protein YacL (UPF0231 family)